MSLKKIAELTNTSISTVSRVLNTPGYTCKDQKLAEKIWQTAKELHYLPNAAAKELRKGSEYLAEPPYTVDLFLTRFNSIKEDAFFNELFNILKEELLMHGCYLGDILNTFDMVKLTQSPSDIKTVPFRSYSSMLSEKADNSTVFIENKKNTGLIIFGKCPNGLIPILKKRYSYIVGIDRNPTDYEYDELICNGSTAAEKAMEYLISLGHRDIAYIGDCTYESRYIGYYQSLLNHKIPLSHHNVFPTSQTEEEGFKAMMSILDSELMPSAIFCANDVTALGVLKAIHSKRKKGYIPSVISIDNITESANTKPMLTTIDIPKHEMVHMAVTLLLDRKNGYHSEIIRLELPCKLIERESCTYANK